MAMLLRITEFTVTSESTPDLTYVVRLSACGCCDTCTCPDFASETSTCKRYRCPHICAARSIDEVMAEAQA